MSHRCCICNKKLRLTEVALQCKCDKMVCKKHRFPPQHNCSYDFAKENKTKLKRDLVHVENPKVIKI